MNIVFLDRGSVGDVDLTEIEKEGTVTTYSVTKPTQVVQRIKKADVVITNKVVLGKKEMVAAAQLKLICEAATGYDNIDLVEARKRNIVVANVAGYSTESVAQHVFSFILSFARSLCDYKKVVKEKKWNRSPHFTLLSFPIVELTGKKLGIIGYGHIGKRVGQLARAFGMEILISQHKGSPKKGKNKVLFDTVLKESDFITVHTPLTKETKNLIGTKEFSLMKKTAIVINAARGGIVNEEALYTALRRKHIRGAALDVMGSEPPRKGSKLFSLENIVVTPHIAWASQESRQRLIDSVAQNIRKFKKGKGTDINLASKLL